MKERVAVLVVSGFLGSGKTTLVRRLLAAAQRDGLRMAVVSNEFGELGIDAALLGSGAERFVELAGGCVCCQLSDDLLLTLQELREKVDPDQIVIETSGVALPFETQLNLYRPPIDGWVGDEAVVVVVNAAQLSEGEGLGDTFETQVSGADILILHKIDLVDPSAVDGLERTLGEMAPGVPIIRACHGEVDPLALFPPSPVRGTRASRPHLHEAFTSEELSVPGGLTPEAAREWLLERRGIRTKGFVTTTEGPRLVQGVAQRMELQVPDGPVPESLLGRVVVIRYHPEREAHHHHG